MDVFTGTSFLTDCTFNIITVLFGDIFHISSLCCFIFLIKLVPFVSNIYSFSKFSLDWIAYRDSHATAVAISLHGTHLYVWGPESGFGSESGCQAGFCVEVDEKIFCGWRFLMKDVDKFSTGIPGSDRFSGITRRNKGGNQPPGAGPRDA